MSHSEDQAVVSLTTGYNDRNINESQQDFVE